MSPPFQDPTTRAGLDAAREVARRRGLPGDDLRVLSARGNLVVHLAPAPVVARVATATAWSRADPAAWRHREVVVAAHAAARGAAVLAPWSDPGPHTAPDRPAVTLWHHADVVPRRPSPAVAGAALADLHRALGAAPAPPNLPWLTPVHEQVTDALAGITAAGLLDAATLAALRAAHAAALAGIEAHDGPVGVLHGDAHAGNLVGVRDHARSPASAADPRWCWTDLEETCRGPLAWDLAVLAGSAGEHGGDRALAAYAARAGTPAPDAATLAPFAAARRVEAAVMATRTAHEAEPSACCTAMAGFREVVGRVLQAGLDLLNKQAESGGQGGRRDGRQEGAGVRQAPTGDRARQISYAPDLDGAADPGEIVWTWVPFEEDASQGKDRPVLVVARAGRGDGGELLGLMLSSQGHRADDREWVGIGSGPWDSQGRDSYVRLDRILEIPEHGIRREGAIVPRDRFDRVADRLRRDHGWS